MRDFPKYLNTRQDYEFVRQQFTPEQWRPVWQALLDSRFVWTTEKDLSAKDKGTIDATHRVVSFVDEKGAEKRAQQTLVESPQAKIFRLGFTVDEVIAALEKTPT